MNTLANIRAAGKSLAILLALIVVAFALAHQTAEAQQTAQKTKTERLLQTDLDIVAIDDNGMTHMHWAALADDGEALKRLIEIGVFSMNPKINTEGKFGGKAKRRAQLLGLNLEYWNRDGETPLHLAAWANSSVAASILIANGADVNATKTKYNSTPLHLATWKNATETAALLLKNGADVNSKTNNGYTPLHSAAYNNATETAALLLKNGADVNAKTNNGRTPLDRAIREKHSEMQSFLRAHGGKRGRDL